MKPSNLRAPFAARACALVAFAVGIAVLPGGCIPGGNEGDRCNPLVLRDECNEGLHCKAATCSASYCCPVNGASSNPNCSVADGCPDAGDDGGEDASEDVANDTGADVVDAASAADVVTDAPRE